MAWIIVEVLTLDPPLPTTAVGADWIDQGPTWDLEVVSSPPQPGALGKRGFHTSSNACMCGPAELLTNSLSGEMK